MTEEQKKKYAEDCKNSGNLDYPLSGCILTPLCKICKNSNYKTAEWNKPKCIVLGDIPDDLRRARIYKCDDFLHDSTSVFNQFFDENLQPIYK